MNSQGLNDLTSLRQTFYNLTILRPFKNALQSCLHVKNWLQERYSLNIPPARRLLSNDPRESTSNTFPFNLSQPGCLMTHLQNTWATSWQNSDLYFLIFAHTFLNDKFTKGNLELQVAIREIFDMNKIIYLRSTLNQKRNESDNKGNFFLNLQKLLC